MHAKMHSACIRDVDLLREAPTPLCDAMNAAGSDKGRIERGWHNYTQLYYRLFAKSMRARRNTNLLEIGIGSVNAQVPSSMAGYVVHGYRPGASARGWRDFFPHAHIYTCDIDRDAVAALAGEERITAFWADQRRPDTIGDALDIDAKFDVIVDDGLHEFAVNVAVMNALLPHLRPGGLYIIEDIPDYDASLLDIERLREFVEDDDAYEFIELPHPVRPAPSDNNLFVVRRKFTPKPTLHVLGLPHTIVNNHEYSTCAFTGKVLRFAKMMVARGWQVVEYSNEGSESEATEHQVVLRRDEFRELLQRRSTTELYDDDIQKNPRLIERFHTELCARIADRTRPGDIVCHVFGAHPAVVAAAPECFHVESGIGYEGGDYRLPYRVFESSAWMHWHHGRHGDSWGGAYNWVVPNYYDSSEWPPAPAPNLARPYNLYFGRLVQCKGLQVLAEVAKRLPDERFVICGQGDPAPWLALAPNLEYHEPVMGRDRAAFLGGAQCVIMPSCFIEPFAGAGVEAQMCGTPLVGSSFGAFRETVEHGRTGFVCHTLADFVEAVRRAPQLDRAAIAERAHSLYSLESVGALYDAVFKQIADLRYKGWYSAKSHQIRD